MGYITYGIITKEGQNTCASLELHLMLVAPITVHINAFVSKETRELTKNAWFPIGKDETLTTMLRQRIHGHKWAIYIDGLCKNAPFKKGP